jgi:hypothetical protein
MLTAEQDAAMATFYFCFIFVETAQLLLKVVYFLLKPEENKD